MSVATRRFGSRYIYGGSSSSTSYSCRQLKLNYPTSFSPKSSLINMQSRVISYLLNDERNHSMVPPSPKKGSKAEKKLHARMREALPVSTQELDQLAQDALVDPEKQEEYKALAVKHRAELERLNVEEERHLMPRSALESRPTMDLTPIDPNAPVYVPKGRSYKTDRRDPWVVQRQQGKFRAFMIFSFCAISFVCFKRNFLGTVATINNPCNIQDLPMLYYLRVFYGRGRSRYFGWFAERDLPMAWRKMVYGTYAKVFGVLLEEIRYPLESYANFQDFFSRALKDGVIQVDKSKEALITSPVDGKVVTLGEILPNQRRIRQVKGTDYDVLCFLGTDIFKKFEDKGEDYGKKMKMVYMVLYLAPGDYHRFHGCCEGFQVEEGRHFPGEMLPIADWLAKRFSDLFCANERVVLSGTYPLGDIHYAAVSAYNVGGMWLDFDPRLKTNQMRQLAYCIAGDQAARPFGSDRVAPFTKESLVGGFKLGSTVVVVAEVPNEAKWATSEGERVRVGTKLVEYHG